MLSGTPDIEQLTVGRVTCLQDHDHGLIGVRLAFYACRPLEISIKLQAQDETESFIVSRDVLWDAARSQDPSKIHGFGNFTVKVMTLNKSWLRLRFLVNVPDLVGDGVATGTLEVIVIGAELRAFVQRTRELVPAHREIELLQLDETIARILG